MAKKGGGNVTKASGGRGRKKAMKADLQVLSQELDRQASDPEMSDADPSFPATVDGTPASSSSSGSKSDVPMTPATVDREFTRTLIASQRWSDKVMAEKEQDEFEVKASS